MKIFPLARKYFRRNQLVSMEIPHFSNDILISSTATFDEF